VVGKTCSKTQTNQKKTRSIRKKEEEGKERSLGRGGEICNSFRCDGSWGKENLNGAFDEEPGEKKKRGGGEEGHHAASNFSLRGDSKRRVVDQRKNLMRKGGEIQGEGHRSLLCN